MALQRTGALPGSRPEGDGLPECHYIIPGQSKGNIGPTAAVIPGEITCFLPSTPVRACKDSRFLYACMLYCPCISSAAI